MRKLPSTANLMALKQKIHPLVACSKPHTPAYYPFFMFPLFMFPVWFQTPCGASYPISSLSLKYSALQLGNPAPSPHLLPTALSCHSLIQEELSPHLNAHSGLSSHRPHTWTLAQASALISFPLPPGHISESSRRLPPSQSPLTSCCLPWVPVFELLQSSKQFNTYSYPSSIVCHCFPGGQFLRGMNKYTGSSEVQTPKGFWAQASSQTDEILPTTHSAIQSPGNSPVKQRWKQYLLHRVFLGNKQTNAVLKHFPQCLAKMPNK